MYKYTLLTVFVCVYIYAGTCTHTHTKSFLHYFIPLQILELREQSVWSVVYELDHIFKELIFLAVWWPFAARQCHPLLGNHHSVPEETDFRCQCVQRTCGWSYSTSCQERPPQQARSMSTVVKFSNIWHDTDLLVFCWYDILQHA